MKKIQDLIHNSIDEIFEESDLTILSLIIIPCVKEMQIYCFSSYDILNPELYRINEKYYEGWRYVPCKYSNLYKKTDTSFNALKSDINTSSVFNCPKCNFSIDKATSFLIDVKYKGNLDDNKINKLEKKINTILLKKIGKPLHELKMQEGW